MKYLFKRNYLLIIGFLGADLCAQNVDPSDFKISALNQIWTRYSQNNEGSMFMDQNASESFDIGLRRTRFYLFGNLTPKVFTYFQFGQNNFNSRFNSQNSNRKLSAFIHDAWAEYQVGKKRNLVWGGGLTIANGLSRYSQPSIGSIATLDVPVFAQATVDQTDQFSRKLSLYVRGQISKLDYRLILSDPFPPTSSGTTQPAIADVSQFSPVGHHLQSQFLFSWNFFDLENHQTPYMTGTYLGKKKVCNISIGGIFQPKAMYRLERSTDLNLIDTVFENMLLLNAETYLEIPLKNTAMFHAYLGCFYTDYGRNYLRMNGIMNTANSNSISGLSKNVGQQYGNSVVMFGTGSQIYSEVAYLLPHQGKPPLWMPYVSFLNSRFQALGGKSLSEYHFGLNYFIDSHRAKITIDFGNRPSLLVYEDRNLSDVTRKNTFLIQYQISI